MRTTIEIIIAILLLAIALVLAFLIFDTHDKVVYLHDMIQEAEKLPETKKLPDNPK